LGTYRDEVADQVAKVNHLMEQLQAYTLAVCHLQIQGLSAEELADWLAELFNSEPQQMQPLAVILLQKTAGNPLFIQQLLKQMYAEEIIRYEQGQWKWDCTAAQMMQVPEGL